MPSTARAAAAVLCLWAATLVAGGPDDDLERGRSLLREGRYEEAVKAFQKANAARQKRCVPCLAWISTARY